MCFTRKGRHLARCSLRLATCTGFGIGRTWYVPTLIIFVLYNQLQLFYLFRVWYYCCVCFIRWGGHVARCSLRLTACTGFRIGRTRYVLIFSNMFKLYVMLDGSLVPTIAPILYKCINADVSCLCIRRFGSTRSPCAGRRFSTRSWSQTEVTWKAAV